MNGKSPQKHRTTEQDEHKKSNKKGALYSMRKTIH